MKQASTNRAQLGVTLVEVTMALFITAVAAGAALPSFMQAQARHRLEAAAAQLETEIQLARSLAVVRNEGVRFTFENDGSASCYVIHSGPAQNCRCAGGAPVCTNGAEPLRAAYFGAASRLRASSSSTSFVFDPIKGTVTPTSTIELRDDTQQHAVRVIVNLMGRARACSTTGLVGFKPC